MRCDTARAMRFQLAHIGHALALPDPAPLLCWGRAPLGREYLETFEQRLTGRVEVRGCLEIGERTGLG